MYGFLIGTATFISVLLAEKVVKSRKIVPINDFWNILLISIPLGIIGGRLYHVLDNFSYYYQYPQFVFQTWRGGLGIFGAFLLVFISLFIYTHLKKQSIFSYTDLFLFFVPLIQIAGRFGNYFNHELFGKPSNLPFAIFIPMEYRPLGYEEFSYFHPLFFYEAALMSILFSYFIMLFYYRDIKIGGGKITSIYLVFYGFTRFILEQFRFNSDYFDIIGVNLSYIFSIGFILLGLVIFFNKVRIKIY